MKILVPSAFEAGTNFAYAINTVKMAEGFSKLGHDVTIACRQPQNGPAALSFLEKQYALHYPLRWKQFKPLKNGKALNACSDFIRQILPGLLLNRPDFIYCRSYISPWLTGWLRLPTAVESHAAPDYAEPDFDKCIQGSGHKKFTTLVTISNVLREGFIARGVPSEKIIVLPDAVDLETFIPPEKIPRSPFGEGPNIVYTGHLYEYKGIGTILAAAALLPQVSFHLIGGRDEDIARVKAELTERGLGNVIVHGHKPRIELPQYTWNADALLLVPSAHHPSAHWTSPVKLGEYLASAIPVISSDIPALRAWLNDGQCLFVAPDSADALAEGVSRLLAEPAMAAAIGKRGQELAVDFCYSKRAQKILAHAGMEQ